MVKIIDVARLAGVSTATVSRALNGQQVREDLRERVLHAASELGYAPNRNARSLRRGHSELVALILPDIENPFFTALSRGVTDVAKNYGLSVVLCNTDERTDEETHFLQIAASEKMAGVILAPAEDAPAVRPLLDAGTAVVVVDRAVSLDVDQVFFDNPSIGYELTSALLAEGRRRIACISGPDGIITADERVEGWRRAHEKAGIPFDSSLVAREPFSVEGGAHAMTALLDLPEPPDAVFAANNLVAVGALRTLSHRGVSPSQVRIGAAGDLPFATSPAHSATHLPLLPRDMGAAAANMLIRRLHDPAAAPERTVQPVGELVRAAD